jgi:hypothetical protein
MAENRKLVTINSTPLGPLMIKEGELLRGDVRLVTATRKLQSGIHYTAMPPVKGTGKLMISPDGADYCNGIAGLHICAPPPQTEDIRDERGFVEVTRRVIVVGRTPTGAMQIVDYSCTFNVRAYFEKDLFGKMKYNKEALYLGSKNEGPPNEGRWHWLELDDGVGIWMDMANEEVVKVWETRSQNRQFADRRCMAVARRNALCQHGAMPGKMIGTYSGDKAAAAPETFSVQAFYWRDGDERSESELLTVANEIAAGRPPQDVEGAKLITQHAGVEAGELDGIADDEPGEQEPEPETALVGRVERAKPQERKAPQDDEFPMP